MQTGKYIAFETYNTNLCVIGKSAAASYNAVQGCRWHRRGRALWYVIYMSIKTIQIAEAV